MTDSLIDKLLTLERTYKAPTAKAAIRTCIAIVGQHQAEQPQDAVTRVAKAISDASDLDDAWQNYQGFAKAAITAMGVPPSYPVGKCNGLSALASSDQREMPLLTDDEAAEIDARWGEATWEEKLSWYNAMDRRPSGLRSGFAEELLGIANHFANRSPEPVSSIEAGAKAIINAHEDSGMGYRYEDWIQDERNGHEGEREHAKEHLDARRLEAQACAEAWGLKWE